MSGQGDAILIALNEAEVECRFRYEDAKAAGEAPVAIRSISATRGKLRRAIVLRKAELQGDKNGRRDRS